MPSLKNALLLFTAFLLSGCASVAPPPAAQAPAGAAGKLPPVAFTPAPTFTDECMAQVARVASGYVYDVSFKGLRRDNDHH
jgi:starvation-inducible outer membrane lipoprotein